VFVNLVSVNLHLATLTFKLGGLTDAQQFFLCSDISQRSYLFSGHFSWPWFIYTNAFDYWWEFERIHMFCCIFRESGCQTHSVTCGAGTGVFLLTRVLHSFLNLHIKSLGCSCSVYFNLPPWISFSAIFSCYCLFFK